MPTYEYQCRECGERLEVFQSFKAKPLKTHADCGGALNKVFHASGVVFKGSGYYMTDSRAAQGSSAKDASDSSSKSESGAKKESGSSDKKSDDSSQKSDSKSDSTSKSTSEAAAS
ncbi:hypothetical protein BH23ACT5_BH23ACT5_02450 [soil metagenome]